MTSIGQDLRSQAAERRAADKKLQERMHKLRVSLVSSFAEGQWGTWEKVKEGVDDVDRGSEGEDSASGV